MQEFGALKLLECKYGWMLVNGPYIGKCFELYGQYSESEVAMMRLFTREGATVIDVGANIGDLTVPLARMVGDAGRVYAFESHPDTFNVLCANLALNAIRNVKPVNAFVADRDDVDTGGGQWGKFAYVSERWDTQFTSIDAFDLAACDLIKVDVDGKELEVLQSAETTIERHRPVLYFENDVKPASEPLLAFVCDTLGYDLYWHLAPIFDEENFYGNPVNHWGATQVSSLMVLGIPSERRMRVEGLKPVAGAKDWWDLA